VRSLVHERWSNKCWVSGRQVFNPLTPNDPYSGRTAPLTSKRCILYIYSTNIGTEYLKHDIYSPFFSLRNEVCFIILTYLVPVSFTFYIQGVLKLKKFRCNDPYKGRTAPLTSKRCILYIYSTNIGTEYFKHGVYSPFFFSSKYSLFHNSNAFGSCIVHILYTGCAEIKKKCRLQKVIRVGFVVMGMLLVTYQLKLLCEDTFSVVLLR